MIAAIMQPTFLPWIGYFDLIDRSDIFVFLDDAQVLKRSWGVRNRVLSKNGETYLTVPLAGHSQSETCTFVSTAVDANPKWRKTHLSTIRHAYSKAPHFAEVFADIEGWMGAGHQTIGDLNKAFITQTAQRMGITTPIAQSSQLEGVGGRKDEWLLSICRALDADTYLSAQGSAAYIEQEQEAGAFAGSGVALRYQNFAHPEYKQSGDEFVGFMSVVDLLMNCGYQSALEIIRAGREPMLTSAQLKELA